MISVSLRWFLKKFSISLIEHEDGTQIPFLSTNVSFSIIESISYSIDVSSKLWDNIDEYDTRQCCPWISDEFKFMWKFRQSMNGPKFMRFLSIGFDENFSHESSTGMIFEFIFIFFHLGVDQLWCPKLERRVGLYWTFLTATNMLVKFHTA